MLFQIGKEYISPPLQTLYFLTIEILALFLPFGNKWTVGGKGVFIEVFDMGNQIALAISNVKASLIVKILAADSGRNLKIGLVIPSNMIFFRLSFPVLLLVQNTQKIIAKGKAQIGVSILQFPVIKGGVF